MLLVAVNKIVVSLLPVCCRIQRDTCCEIIIIIIKNEKIRVTLCENAAGALYIVNNFNKHAGNEQHADRQHLACCRQHVARPRNTCLSPTALSKSYSHIREFRCIRPLPICHLNRSLQLDYCNSTLLLVMLSKPPSLLTPFLISYC